jgi:hypothetical protein
MRRFHSPGFSASFEENGVAFWILRFVTEVRLIHDEEEVFAVHHVPMPVPIDMIPVVIRVHCCAFSGVHHVSSFDGGHGPE